MEEDDEEVDVVLLNQTSPHTDSDSVKSPSEDSLSLQRIIVEVQLNTIRQDDVVGPTAAG